MTITHESPGVYSVQSDSGKTYTIRRVQEPNRVWECSCPAGSYGKACKHVAAVAAAATSGWATLAGLEPATACTRPGIAGIGIPAR